MKLVVTFKTPDAVDHAIAGALEADARLDVIDDEEERHLVRDALKEKLREAVAEFVRYDEYIDVEFDTRTGKAKVLPVKG